MKVFGGLVAVLWLVVAAYYWGRNSATNSYLAKVYQISPTPLTSPIPTNPVPTLKPVSGTKLMSTKGWVWAENKVFRIKYPGEMFKPMAGENYIQLQSKNNSGNLMTNSPNFWIVDNYKGGSRRQWYLDQNSYYANEVVFTDKMLGKINVLEVRPMTTEIAQDILVTNGKILIDAMPQGANLNLVETIVSTLEFK